MTLRTDHIWGKPLARQTERGPDLSCRRPRMLYELGAQRPQSSTLGWELLGEKSRLPEWAGIYDSRTQWR
jgi:hypothetical protein